MASEVEAVTDSLADPAVVRGQPVAASATAQRIALGAMLRRAGRAFFDAAERVLHARRRKAACRQLARLPHLRRVLFVCHGNVCRSAFAAAVFRDFLRRGNELNVEVVSAGFIGPGRSSPAEAVSAALRRGQDLSAHVSTLVDAHSVSAADLIVVMSAAQASAVHRLLRHERGLVLALGDLDPQPIRQRTIPDPWGRDQTAFDESFARVERCVASLIEALPTAKGRSTA